MVSIDKNNSGCGVIDRFLADIVTSKNKLRVKIDSRSLPKIISLLLMLGTLRTKAFPKILAIIEAILRSPFGSKHSENIEEHLSGFLNELSVREADNRYLLIWIIYFLRANGLDNRIKNTKKFSDPIVKSVLTSRFTTFDSCKDFKVFQGVKRAARQVSLLDHLRVFPPQ